MNIEWILPTLVGAVLGAFLTYVVSFVLHRQTKDKRRLRVTSTYCEGLLAASAGPLSETVEIMAGGQVVVQPVVVNYVIRCVGNKPAKDVRMLLETPPGDRIINHKVYVAECVQCERLTRQRESENRVRFGWTHINPGDWIAIAVLVAPCRDAQCLQLSIDGEDVAVERTGMKMDCSTNVLQA